MNLQEELKALKERIAELEELAKEEQEFPKVDDTYWFIGDEGEAYCTNYIAFRSDRNHKSIGNIFHTKEQAEFAVEKLKVEAELREFSKPFDTDSLTFTICFDVEENELYSETRRFMSQGSIYFGWGQAEQAMSEVGKDRIKKYIFGVED